jgi:hypothetical protein
MTDPREVRARFPRVFGILSIIFGGLGALSAPNNIRSATSNLMQFMVESALHRHLLLGAVIYLGVSGVALVFVGIGQLRYRAWARVATLVWSASALLFVVAMEIIVFGVIVPSTSESTEAWFLVLWQVFGAVALSVYPILMWVYFRGERARLWMNT